MSVSNVLHRTLFFRYQQGRSSRLPPRGFGLAVLLASLVCLCAPAGAFADQAFEQGNYLGVATDGYTGSKVVDVHEGTRGDLYYHVGAPYYPDSGSSEDIAWCNGYYGTWYDSGYYPSVGVGEYVQPSNDPSGFSSIGDQVVTTYQTSPQNGPLRYRLGTLSGCTVNWTAGGVYDNFGARPAVAIGTGSASTNTVVEVHQGADGVGPLWYRVGVALGSGVQWGDSHPYDAGTKPSVAIDGNTVVEVHQEGSAVGPLDYRIGFVSASTKTITWQSPHRFGTGLYPSVSDRGGYVRVAYQEAGGFGAMDFALGKVTLYYCGPNCSSTRVVAWSGVYHDANGVRPSIAGYFDPTLTSSSIANWRGFVEVHEGGESIATWDWEHADLPQQPIPR